MVRRIRLYMDVFEPALQELNLRNWDLYGPESFRDYLKRHDLSTPSRSTPQFISVDTLETLAPSLRQAGVMVLRLGEAGDKATGTQFALISTPRGRLEDFFLVYSWDEKHAIIYLANTNLRNLLPFLLLPRLTERSALNLAFASGLLARALRLDDSSSMAVPAMGKNTFTFSFQPHEALPIALTHNRGQVEMNAIFVGHRDGKDCVFLIEAKAIGGRTKRGTIAKHKLVYPLLGIAPNVPPHMPIIPVFLGIESMPNDLRYHIIECELPDPRLYRPVLCNLTAKTHEYYVLPIPSFTH